MRLDVGRSEMGCCQNNERDKFDWIDGLALVVLAIIVVILFVAVGRG